jgi:hypothetical protein
MRTALALRGQVSNKPKQLQPFELGLRVSAVVDTGRTVFAKTADRYTLRLDVHNRPTKAVIDGGAVQVSTSGRSNLNLTRQV